MSDNQYARVRCILFDCMETLVDMTQIPTLRDYALWAFEGSGVEHLWYNFEEYFIHYQKAKETLAQKLPEYKEYELRERFERIVAIKLTDAGGDIGKADQAIVRDMADKLYRNYWRVYLSKSYMHDDVRPLLHRAAETFRLGVVSNFLVQGGIEELLQLHGIAHFFDFIITSVNEGWRKPHPAIFTKAINEAGCLPEEIIFIGDNFEQDYEGSLKMGLRPILLDRKNQYPWIEERVTDFYALNRKFSGITKVNERKSEPDAKDH